MLVPTKYKSYQGYIFLETNFAFFLNNLLTDSNLTNDQKFSFFDYLTGYSGSSENEFIEYCQLFFRKHQLLGKKIRNPENQNPFVRIVVSPSFFGRIGQLTGLEYNKIRPLIMEMAFTSNTIYREALLKKFLNNIVLPKNYMTERDCLLYFGVKEWTARLGPRLADAKIDSYLQWSFPQPDDEDIFLSQDSINDLDCRAGMVDKTSKICFVHNIDKALSTSKPTCFDAEFYPQFRIGGKTEPLDDCKKKKGFDEIIHKSNTFRNLTSEFYEIHKS